MCEDVSGRFIPRSKIGRSRVNTFVTIKNIANMFFMGVVALCPPASNV